MKKPLITGVLILFVTLKGMSQAGSFSLSQAQAYAIKNSPIAKMSEIEIEKAKNKVWETKAIGLPQVNATAGFQHFINIPISVIPAEQFNPLAPPGTTFEMQFGTEQTANAGLTASQLIFSGSYIVGLKAVKQFLALSEAQKNKGEIDIRDAVSTAYFTVLVAQENSDILQQSLTLAQKTLSETKALNEAGFVEEQDYQQLELMVGTIQTNLANANRQTQIASDLLKFNMGLDLEKSITLSDDLEKLIEQINPTLSEQPAAVNQHPDMQLAMTQLRLAELNLSNERSKYLPTLSAYFSHTVSSNGFEFETYKNDDGDGWFPATLVGLNLELPIFASGMKRAVVQQKALDVQKALIQKDQVTDGLEMQVKQSRSEFKFAIESLATSKKNLDLASDIKRKTLVKFQEGVVGSMELTTADRQFQESQGQYINALFQLLNSKSKLDKALSKF